MNKELNVIKIDNIDYYIVDETELDNDKYYILSNGEKY